MGRARRPTPKRLAPKLREIRDKLGLTQQEMFDLLGDTGTQLYVGHIDGYEKGRREPPLQVLLRYSRVASVTIEMLVDDELHLPKQL